VRHESPFDAGRSGGVVEQGFNIRLCDQGEDNDTYYTHLGAALDHKPQMTWTNGALVTML